MRNVECYILDEPDLGLDPKAWKAVCEKIISLKNNGKSVLITGQNYPMLQELVNRIVVLKNGQALYEGNLADFIEKYDPDNGSMRKAFEKITGETGEAL